MFSALGAIAAGISAATGIAGTVIGSGNASAAAKQQNQIAAANLQNAQNQQNYQKALNQIALQRSISGTTSGRGDVTSYDPATNSWSTKLSPTSQRIQNASDQASISRNTSDLAQQQENNALAMKQAIAAREGAGPALAAVRNFRPETSRELEGDLQETATTANRQAQQPMIADTLRSFARTGTAAAPVLTQMMRDNATSLRQTMLQDKIGAMTNQGAVNNANLSPLVSKFQMLNNAAHPNLSYAPLDNNSPTDALTQLMTARANQAPSSASQGAYSTNSYGTNQAAGLAIQHPDSSNLGATILGAGNTLGNALSPNGSISKFIAGTGNSGGGGPTTLGNVFGTNQKDTFGNTIGADSMNRNWQNTQNFFAGLNGSDNNNAGA